MPKGKARPNGYVLGRPPLPDCSCIELLKRDKKHDIQEISEEELLNYIGSINNAISLYIGATNSTPLTTTTEAIAKYKKIKTAASKILELLHEVTPWHKKLTESLKLSSLGVHSKDYLHRYVRRKEGDIFSLEKILDNKICINSNNQTIHTITVLSEMDLKKLVPQGNSRDPYLKDLIIPLSKAWIAVTGRSIYQTPVSKDSNDKQFLFAEWIQEIVITANKHLPDNKQVDIPKEGTILDIIKSYSL